MTVDIIAVGTGKALRLGENGDVDVVLVVMIEVVDVFVVKLVVDVAVVVVEVVVDVTVVVGFDANNVATSPADSIRS